MHSKRGKAHLPKESEPQPPVDKAQVHLVADQTKAVPWWLHQGAAAPRVACPLIGAPQAPSSLWLCIGFPGGQ